VVQVFSQQVRVNLYRPSEETRNKKVRLSYTSSDKYKYKYKYIHRRRLSPTHDAK